MSSVTLGSASSLVDGILKGQVPRQVRLFAAQGLLPVARDELVRLQLVLSADPDPELAAVAKSSVGALDEAALVAWVRSEVPGSLELDLLARLRREQGIWAAVAGNPRASNETLRVLARNGTPLVQDIIITNQVRILACLELLEDLRDNAQVSGVVLRRVHEFEEEFIAKAVAAAEAVPEVAEAAAPSIEQALAALRAIGAHIPAEEELPIPAMVDDPALAEEIQRQGTSAFGRILRMSVKDLITLGLKGGREERAILINSRNRLVVRAVLSSPKLTDLEAERFAASRSVSEEVIRLICDNRRWVRRYQVMLALTQNPKTPLQTALRMLASLSQRDVARISRDRNVHPVVRRQAIELTQRAK